MNGTGWGSLSRVREVSLGVLSAWLNLLFVFGSAHCYGASASESKVVISCDLACVYAVDKFQGQIVPGGQAVVHLAPGTYTVEVASSDGADYWKTTMTIDGQATSPYPAHALLQAERTKRLAREQEVKVLRDSADVKRQELARMKTENADLAKEGPEIAAVGKEAVRLIEKYGARYESELEAGNKRKQDTESVKASLPLSTTTTYATLAKAAGEAALLKLYTESQRHLLASNAAMYRINLLTSLLNVLSRGAHSQPARTLLRNALTYQVTWDGISARLWIGDSTMELSRGNASAGEHSKNAPDSPRLSFSCADIQDVHTAGAPVVRSLAELAGTGEFVVRLASRSLNLSGTSDNDRKTIMGTFYVACPALTADSALDPAWVTALQRIQWPASQPGAPRTPAVPQTSGKQSPPAKGASTQSASTNSGSQKTASGNGSKSSVAVTGPVNASSRRAFPRPDPKAPKGGVSLGSAQDFGDPDKPSGVTPPKVDHQ